MGLRATITSAVDSAWKSLSDIPQSTILRRTTKTYTPSNGQWTVTNTDYPVSAVFTRYEAFEIDKVSVLSTDLKCIMRTNSLSITPNISSDRVVVDGTVYSIVRVYKDSAGVVTTLQLRLA